MTEEKEIKLTHQFKNLEALSIALRGQPFIKSTKVVRGFSEDDLEIPYVYLEVAFMDIDGVCTVKEFIGNLYLSGVSPDLLISFFISHGFFVG